MKPWYKKKKFWVAIMTGVIDALAVALDKPELIAPLTALGGILIAAIGLEDQGKGKVELLLASKEEDE